MPSTTFPNEYLQLKPTFNPCLFLLDNTFKESVQRKVRWVKSGVLIDGYWFSVEALDIVFFERDIILDFARNVFPPLRHRLLVMWEGIGEALQMVCSTSLYGSRAL
jgi:hypothetical protein